jgi:uncharacterized membrane protein
VTGGVGSQAIGVSGDGSVVVGVSNLNPGFSAFHWTADGGMRDLWVLLLSQGVDPAANGWTQLHVASGVSADGRTIIGTGIRNGNSEAFVAVVPEPASIGLVLPLAAATLRRRRNLAQSI